MTTAETDNHDGLRQLSDRIDSELAALLEPGSEVALVNFPNIRNVGDSAIWLGTRRALDRAQVRVRYGAEPATYRRKLLAKSVGERGTILVQGGGNLGDVYPHQHRIRRRVLKDFPAARVIQLPQSIWFRSAEGAEDFRSLAEGHADYTLMLRDNQSMDWARERLDVPLVLCPDLAFGLGTLERRTPDRGVLWLMHRNQESGGLALPDLGPDEERAGWFGKQVLHSPQGRRLRLWLAANGALEAAMARDGLIAASVWRASAATHGPIARHRLEAGTKLLSRARVVVTDRLHGHVLSLLLRIPHVFLDNAYGKNRALWEAWTSGFASARWADDPLAAQRLARELLDTSSR